MKSQIISCLKDIPSKYMIKQISSIIISHFRQISIIKKIEYDIIDVNYSLINKVSLSLIKIGEIYVIYGMVIIIYNVTI